MIPPPTTTTLGWSLRSIPLLHSHRHGTGDGRPAAPVSRPEAAPPGPWGPLHDALKVRQLDARPAGRPEAPPGVAHRCLLTLGSAGGPGCLGSVCLAAGSLAAWAR